MADFKVFSESGNNLLSNANFNTDTDVVNGFQANTSARSVAMNSYLKSVGLVCKAIAKYIPGTDVVGPQSSDVNIDLLQPFEFKQNVEWTTVGYNTTTTTNLYNLVFPSSPTTFKARFVCNIELEGSGRSSSYVLGFQTSSGNLVQIVNGSLQSSDLVSYAKVIIEAECLDDISKVLYIKARLIHEHGASTSSTTLEKIVDFENIYSNVSYDTANRFSFYMSFTALRDSTAYISGSSKTSGITFTNTNA